MSGHNVPSFQFISQQNNILKYTIKNQLSILGSYDTVVVKLKIWPWKLIAHEYTVP